MPKFSDVINLSTAMKAATWAGTGVLTTVTVQNFTGFSESSKAPQREEVRGEQKKMGFEIQQLSAALEKEKREVEMSREDLAKGWAALREEKAAFQQQQAATTAVVVAEPAKAVAVTTVEPEEAPTPPEAKKEMPAAPIPTDNTPKRPAVFDGGNREPAPTAKEDEKKEPSVAFGSSGDVVTIEKGGAVPAETERLQKEVKNLRRRLREFQERQETFIRAAAAERRKIRDAAAADRSNSNGEDVFAENDVFGSGGKGDGKGKKRRNSLWIPKKTLSLLLSPKYANEGRDRSGSDSNKENVSSEGITNTYETNVAESTQKKKEPWKGATSDVEKVRAIVENIQKETEGALPPDSKDTNAGANEAFAKRTLATTILNNLLNNLKSEDENLENLVKRHLKVDIEDIADEENVVHNFLEVYPEYKGIRSFGVLAGIAGTIRLSIREKKLTPEDVLQALRDSVPLSAPRILKEVTEAPKVTEKADLKSKRDKDRSAYTKDIGEYTISKDGVKDSATLVEALKKGAEKDFQSIFDKKGFIASSEKDIDAFEKIRGNVANFVFKPNSSLNINITNSPVVVTGTEAPAVVLPVPKPVPTIGGGVPLPPPMIMKMVPKMVRKVDIKDTLPSEKKTKEEKMPGFSYQATDGYDSQTIEAFFECDGEKAQTDQGLADQMKTLWDETNPGDESNNAEYKKLIEKRRKLREGCLKGRTNKLLGMQWRMCSDKPLKDWGKIEGTIQEIEEFLAGKNPEHPVDRMMLRQTGKMNDSNKLMLERAYKLRSQYRALEQKMKDLSNSYKTKKKVLDLWKTGLKIEVKNGEDVEVSLPDLGLLSNEKLYSFLYRIVEKIVSLDILSVSTSSADSAFANFANLCPHLKGLKRLKVVAPWGYQTLKESIFNGNTYSIRGLKLHMPDNATNECRFLSAIAIIPGLDELEIESVNPSSNKSTCRLGESEMEIQSWLMAIERCKTVKLPCFANLGVLLGRIQLLEDIDKRERHFVFDGNEDKPLDSFLSDCLFKSALNLVMSGKGMVSVGFSGVFNSPSSKKFKLSKALMDVAGSKSFFRETMFEESTKEKKEIEDPETKKKRFEFIETEGTDEKWLAFLEEKEKFSNGEKGKDRICKSDSLTYDEILGNLGDWLRVFGIPTKEFVEELLNQLRKKDPKGRAVEAMVEMANVDQLSKEEAEKKKKALEAGKKAAAEKAAYAKTHANYDDFRRLLSGLPVYVSGSKSGVSASEDVKDCVRPVYFGDHVAFFLAAFLLHLDDDRKSYYLFDMKTSVQGKSIGFIFPGFGDGEAFPAHRESGEISADEQAAVLEQAIQYSKKFSGKASKSVYDQVADIASVRENYEKTTLKLNEQNSPDRLFACLFGSNGSIRFPKFVQVCAKLKDIRNNVVLYHKRLTDCGQKTDSKLFDIYKLLAKTNANAEALRSMDAKIPEEEKELKLLEEKELKGEKKLKLLKEKELELLLGKDKLKPEEEEKKEKIKKEKEKIKKEKEKIKKEKEEIKKEKEKIKKDLVKLKKNREECSMQLRKEIDTLEKHKAYLAGFAKLIDNFRAKRTPSAITRVLEDGTLEDRVDPAFKTPNVFGVKNNAKNPTTGNLTNKNSAPSWWTGPKANNAKSKAKHSKMLLNVFKQNNSPVAFSAWVRNGRKVKYYNNGVVLDVLAGNQVVVSSLYLLQYADSKKKKLRILNKRETPNLDIVEDLVRNGSLRLKQETDGTGKPIKDSYYVQFQVIEEK